MFPTVLTSSTFMPRLADTSFWPLKRTEMKQKKKKGQTRTKIKKFFVFVSIDQNQIWQKISIFVNLDNFRRRYKTDSKSVQLVPDVWGVTVIVGELKEVIWAALLIRERALNFWLQHVLSYLVTVVHAL